MSAAKGADVVVLEPDEKIQVRRAVSAVDTGRVTAALAGSER
jgi:hypothetical protein